MRGPVPSRQHGCDCVGLAPAAPASNPCPGFAPTKTSTRQHTTPQVFKTRGRPPTTGKKMYLRKPSYFSGIFSWKKVLPQNNYDGIGAPDKVLRRCRSSAV